MGIMDMIGSLTGDLSKSSETAKVAGGLVQALQEHPDGIQGILNSFTKNGMEDHATEMATGQASTTTPEQVQQGLAGSGFLEKAAQHAGVSPEVAAMAVSTVLPMLMQHFAPGGQAAPQSSMGGLAQQFLSKFTS
jgi:uncharacterized protein YidB (DUF937 family)